MTSTKNKTIVVVVGPTAVGKTAMAIELAKKFSTEILSADSRQFYREMSIGTAKPSLEELAQAKHHFIDSHSITEPYSAGDFERDALVLLSNLFLTKDVAIVVGGSGLFIRALCEGLDSLPNVSEEIRSRLNLKAEQEGIASFQELLKTIDPAFYESQSIHNTQRVIRAMEIYEATGNPISYYQQKNTDKRPFNIITIGLNTDRQLLYDRINKRVDGMMANGLLEEVKGLENYKSYPALQTVGYAELFDYLDTKISLLEATDKIKQNSRKYAKRQITWFKKYGETEWFEPNDTEGILDYIDQKL
ncbi:tRNA (adenosine(37)-N6)-dimethylallyltransferase MiaA [Sphingobacterium hungaricum]|uniref:tRNA (adenosine(37)-N6)-dimethylallyltransferase MiaA n=1 Tax=Sphingobacterium hungaricum TaxID=2082723 RepID=UPI001E40F56C|nr:tRNA (adenosine(37)-N6)-dimethylallyltransferase MiaA [Sphingobacterium hungaricum]